MPATRTKRGRNVAISCDECRRRRRRCDGEQTCGPCIKRGTQFVKEVEVFVRGRKAKAKSVNADESCPVDTTESAQSANASISTTASPTGVPCEGAETVASDGSDKVANSEPKTGHDSADARQPMTGWSS
ncbi:hypothetical protein BDV25DRAFT_137104 [Aspergillus avenaceus]|uniref:Zn(2)-C6 fungal-type domain-containing protein n=1 Tax=Aspergillus avenaceus TaxID=36643 RepID=A0A5N6U3V8_ASPAV|nr:hypothetical protein BDV25DRAFT_137104 [Aspergillus avenaceus]